MSYMYIRESILRKLKWEHTSNSSGEKVRYAEYEGQLIVQKRVVFPETSRVRLSLKAIEGSYSLTDMMVRGTGNTFLVIGWETVPSLVSVLMKELIVD